MSLFYTAKQRGKGSRVAAMRVKKQSIGYLACVLFLLSLAMMACAGDPGASNTTHPSVTLTPAPLALTQLAWCNKPNIVFRDQAAATDQKAGSGTPLGPADGKPKVLTDWNTVKENLGFTVYLPQTLPTGTCLLSVSSSLRDKIFGSNFTITYVLPNQDAISFSQAPMHSQHIDFQCTVAQDTAVSGTADKGTPIATQTSTTAAAKNPVQLCNGIQATTNIVFSARGTATSLQQFFNGLRPNVDWVPAR